MATPDWVDLRVFLNDVEADDLDQVWKDVFNLLKDAGYNVGSVDIERHTKPGGVCSQHGAEHHEEISREVEREACAKVVEDFHAAHPGDGSWEAAHAYAVEQIAQQIRGRSGN